ncbi:hypothetical protein [uncultured Ruminococcus sp.]|uniref:hypothetical protein n=1 Tax=uncultured Ruminococcus sp. TaxID=165186 RepID=UPI00265E9F36|nr:hypothetical protein [uncultured Ruminococcus sp.]
MRNIFILFDCPDNDNDKQWLFDILNNKYTRGSVQTIPVYEKIAKIKRGTLIKKIRAYRLTVLQCLRAFKKSKPDDIIICWSTISGLVFNLISRLLGNKRYIICFNWLTPPMHHRSKIYSLFRYTATNKMCRMIINSQESEKQWVEYLKINNINNFVFIPDVYDRNIDFIEPNYKKDRYCFTGGMANRDWALLIAVAERIPNIRFVCVALEKDFKEKVNSIPFNVDVKYNISIDQYYDLMKNASLVLLPLEKNIVSGLINITHSAQYGNICCVSNTSAAKVYFDEMNKDLLMPKDIKKWANKIDSLMKLDENAYVKKAKSFQEYIISRFSPDMAANTILDIINDF